MKFWASGKPYVRAWLGRVRAWLGHVHACIIHVYTCVLVDTVFFLPSICMLDPENFKNVNFLP